LQQKRSSILLKRRRSIVHWPLLALLAPAAAVGWCFYAGILVLPDRHNPWAPLRLEDPPGWLTRYKLQRIAGDPALCRKILDAAPVAEGMHR
jgi:hypothetical protein